MAHFIGDKIDIAHDENVVAVIEPNQQLSENGGQQKKQTCLEQFLNTGRKTPMTPEELKEFEDEQRANIDEMNAGFWMMTNEAKVETSIFVTVKISQIESNRVFRGVETCDLGDRQELQNCLNAFYREYSEPFARPKVKDLCAVFQDGDWLRGEIIDIVIETIGKRRMIVYLIDYGRTIRVKQKHLRLLRKQHLLDIPYAIKCQLSVLNTDENEISREKKVEFIEKFKRYAKETDQVLLYVNGLTPDKEDCYDVLMFAEGESETGSAYFFNETYGAFYRPEIRFDIDICATWFETLIQKINESKQKPDKNHVYVTHCTSPKAVYVKSVAAHLSQPKIRKILNSYIASFDRTNYNCASTVWTVGQNCMVLAQNAKTKTIVKMWCRGQITQSEFFPREGMSYEVFLRDYGQTVSAKSPDLLPITPELAALGNVVSKCYLDIADGWPESSITLLKDFVEEYDEFAISCSDKTTNGFPITLWATKMSTKARVPLSDIKDSMIWDDIGLKIISKLIRGAMESFIQKSQWHYNRYNGGEKNDDSDTSELFKEYQWMAKLRLEDIETNANEKKPEATGEALPVAQTQKRFVHKWLPALPFDATKFIGFVTHITSKGFIYIQEQSRYDEANELELAIHEHIKTTKHTDKSNYMWVIGEACFAFYYSRLYYRGVIKKIRRESALCLVYYVDYGNKEWVHLDNLYPAWGFGDIPTLVHQCYITSMLPTRKNGKWHPKTLAEFKSQVLNQLCTVEIHKSVHDHLDTVKLIPCSLIDPILLPCDIHKWMVKHGLVNKIGVDENDDEIVYV